MSNSLLRVHEFTFGKIVFFFGKKFNFWKPLTSTKKFLGLFEKSFSRDIKTAFYVFKWKLGEKVFGNLLLSSIFFDEQKNLNFRWKLFHSPLKLYLTCGWQQLGKKYVPLLYRNVTFLGFQSKFSSRVSSKLHYICSQPTYEHLINFWWKICIYKFFGMWAKNNQTVRKKTWQESMLHVRRKLLVSHTFFLKRMFLFVRSLGVWAKKHQLFDKNYRESPQNCFVSVHGII